MKIAIVSKADSFGGGASRVAEELTMLARNRGFTVHHYCSWTGKGYNEIRRGLYGRFEKLVRGLHYVTKKIGFPEMIPYELPFLLRRLHEYDYDLIHFHDLSSAISPVTLMFLSKKVPVVWTLHDCSPFTGGCLYPMECVKYKNDCKKCPQIGEWPIDSKFDFVFLGRALKKRLHKSGKISLITPSKWMADMALSSGMVLKKPTVISNGVNTDVFQALNKKDLKKILGLPLDRPVILLSAGNILDERKGTRYAVETLKRINKKLHPYLIVVGIMNEDAKKIFSEFDHLETGYLSNDYDLNKYYAAADIFLFCSLADNQPLVILETMASGTPMVGFQTGGISEMVENGVNGMLVPQRDVDALERALIETLENKNYIQWAKNAREKAVKEYSYEKFLNSHLHFYESVIKNFLEEYQHEF